MRHPGGCGLTGRSASAGSPPPASCRAAPSPFSSSGCSLCRGSERSRRRRRWRAASMSTT
eukprot:8106071-Lingulodinium_polyedra.AAC.1